jgi:hypothetical protein
MMGDADHPRSARGTWVTLVAVVGMLVVLAVPLAHPHVALRGTAGEATAAYSSAGSMHTWSNGAIRLSFPSPHPAFSLGSLAVPNDRVNQTLTGIAEINANGAIDRFARFSSPNATWAIASRSTTNVTVVSLTGKAPVFNYSGEWESGDDSPLENGSVGNVSASIALYLNSTASPDPWTVGYSINVSAWPWMNTTDYLGVEVRSNLSPAPGHWILGTGNSLSAVGATNATLLATYRWESSALAVYSGGGEEDSQVGSYHNFSTSGGSSLLRLEFGSVSGGYAALAYDPWLGIVPLPKASGPLPAWLFTPASLAVIAAGSAGIVVLAIWTRSSRRPPESGL